MRAALPFVDAEHSYPVELGQFGQNAEKHKSGEVDNEVSELILCVE